MHRDLQKLTAESADMSVVSSDGVYRYVSPAARRLLGWDPAEIEGHQEDEFVHPEDLPSLLASRSVSAPEGAVVMYRFRCADGSYLWVEATSRTVEADGSTFVVASVRDVAERQKSNVLLHHRAATDPLTGVANRTVLMDRLGHAIRRLERAHSVLAVLFLDLDRFKVINDSLGHRVGDAILQTMAQRLLRLIRGSDTLARLGGDEFVVVAEVSAPRGVDLSGTIAQANRFHDLGAIAVNIPDYPKSGARASALALGVLIEQQSHVETLLHYSCRDRNLIGMQSDLLGAHAMGLRNVLLTTGDPPRQGSYPDATSIFDVDAIGLVNMVARLNQGLDIGGQSIGAPTRFHMGVGVNPFAPNPDGEWRRLDFKVDAGAEFIMTPPILDLEAFDAVLDRLRQAGLPILAGVIGLESLRQAEFVSSEVPGVKVADEVLDRLRTAADPAAEGLAIATEIMQGLRTRVQGVHVTGLHGSPAAVERLLAGVRASFSQAQP